MKTSFNLTKWVGIGVVGVLLVTLFISIINFNNNEIDLRNNFDQKINERTAFYEKMFRIIKGKTQIAVKNDKSFKEALTAQVEGQKNGEQLMMAWITQSNPTATYTEVTRLYEQLSNTIEGERNGFFENEKILSDIQRQHSNLIEKFPGSFYNLILRKEKIKYTPIQASSTVDVMKTGIDNNVDLDLN